MKAQIIQMVGNQMVASTVDVENLIAAMEVRGAKFKGLSPSYADRLAKNPNAAVPRQMLWEQPQFDGFAGPMYGRDYDTGEDCLRYEAWKAYEILSA